MKKKYIVQDIELAQALARLGHVVKRQGNDFVGYYYEVYLPLVAPRKVRVRA